MHLDPTHGSVKSSQEVLGEVDRRACPSNVVEKESLVEQ
jgi:hypothetical protein